MIAMSQRVASALRRKDPGRGSTKKADRKAATSERALAALEASRGRHDAAEATIRETLAIGFLLIDDGPTLLDNLTGASIARMSGMALEALFGGLGRPEAGALVATRTSTERALGLTLPTAGDDVATALRRMPDVVLDSAALRGVRWEYLMVLNTVGPCLNARRVVFGPDDAQQVWLEAARVALVRSPAEDALFDLALGGLFGGLRNDEPGLPVRLLALTMGGTDRVGSCGRAVAGLLGGA